MARQKKRRDGRYEKKFTFEGKRYSVFGRTAAELSEREAEKRQQLTRAKENHDDPTLTEYRKRWEARRSGAVKASTEYTERTWYKKAAEILLPDINKKFGDLKLSEITIDDLFYIQTFLGDSMTTTSCNSIMSHINTILTDAYKLNMIDYNPMIAIKSIKRTEPKARDTIHRALSDAEQKAFFENAKSSSYINLYKFLINTGVRIGEAGALLPQDIDKDYIHIRRTLTETDAGVEIGKDTKTKAGRRNIPLNDTIRAIIKAEKEHNKEIWDDRIIYPDKPIFRSVEGQLLRTPTINSDVLKVCTAARIDKITLHSFRATFCTNAIDAGVPMKVVQELMGHASISMTADLYGHAKEERKTEAMQIIERRAI